MEIRDINNAEDFKSFLLIYLAEADYKVTEEEKSIILNHVSLEQYEHIKHAIDRLSDFECLDIIARYQHQYLPNLASKEALLAEMEHLYEIDPKHSVLERNMILGLKKIMLT